MHSTALFADFDPGLPQSVTTRHYRVMTSLITIPVIGRATFLSAIFLSMFLSIGVCATTEA